jgi:predicted MFS family arabinose efflux permease
MSVYALAGMALSLAIGGWIGRRGLDRAVVAALGALFIGTLLGLVAPGSGGTMLASRALEGVGFAFAAIAGPAIALERAAPRHLGLVTGVIAGWIPVGQLLATALARLFLALELWQGPWMVSLALTAAMAAWHVRSRSGSRRQGIAITAAARASTPLAWPALVIGATIFMLWSSQYFAFMTWLPVYLVDVGELTDAAAALAYALPVATLLATNVVTGVALRRRARLGPLLAVGLAAQAGAWFAMPLAGGTAGAAALLVFYGIGAGITPTCLFALPAALAAGDPARGFAVLMTGRNVGVLAGPLALAWIADVDWELAVPAFGGAGAVAAVAGIWVAARLAAASRA